MICNEKKENDKKLSLNSKLNEKQRIIFKYLIKAI